ncbi:MAG TPA: DUF1565 domain-containing protein [Polyangia bacterium]|nr:DUF1565 domain-containing protein [Polyangia bacterium]
MKRRRLRLCAGAAILIAGCGGGSTPAPASVMDGVQVVPAAVARQGQTGAVLTLTRASGGLAHPAAIDLGDLSAAVGAGSDDRHLVLNLTVPHGAAPGKRVLTVTTPAGDVRIPDAIEVSAITVDPAGADENAGSAVAPFRTLARAVAVAGPGDRITVLDGTYGADSGETWGYQTPDDLVIGGASATGARLLGTAEVAFRAGHNLTLQSLQIEGFTSAVLADSAGASLTITGGELQAAGSAIVLGPSCAACGLRVDGTAIATAGDDSHAIDLPTGTRGARVTVAGAVLNGDIYVDDLGSTVSVTDTSIRANSGNNGIFFNGGTLAVSKCQIAAHVPFYGVQLQDGAMALSNLTIDGGTYGIYHSAGTAKLRATTIQNFSFVGYYLSTGDLDLGTGDDAGGNVFVAPDQGYGLYVARLGVAKPVTSSNSSFNGQTPPAGELTGAVDLKGHFFINVGEVVSFFVR